MHLSLVTEVFRAISSLILAYSHFFSEPPFLRDAPILICLLKYSFITYLACFRFSLYSLPHVSRHLLISVLKGGLLAPLEWGVK